MIYIAYAITAALVVFLSMKASKYVDLIDKKTSLSGAFIGGIMLSAVTSLPELFTSLSSTIFLDKPGLCIGNILGSNLFNIAILALLLLFSMKSFSKAKISPNHMKVTVFVLLVYVVMMLNFNNILNFEIATISITSIAIFVLYALSVKYLSAENGDDHEDTKQTEEADTSDLTLKQIIVRFILTSIGIIGLSILITYITDEIATIHNLGAGLAGAIFLGVATSLPEVSSTIALFRIKNYDIAIGNIIGSNIFNFLILSLADIFYIGNGIYNFSDPQTLNLLVFGTIATPIFLVLLKFRNRVTQVLCPIGIISCYMFFLLV